MKKILAIIGSICLIYGIIVLMIIGFGNVFSWFFTALGIFLFLLSFLYRKLSRNGRTVLIGILTIGFLLFASLEAGIICFGHKRPEAGADYLILLGSGVSEKGVSIDFKARIEAAASYLKENTGTDVIATGAQGNNEPVSEASAAREYLIDLGIEEERILLEDQSYSTLQNLQNAKQMIEEQGQSPEDCSIVIVSSSFHLYRAGYIARQIGFTKVSCLGSHGLRILDPQYYTREFFGLVKEWLYFRNK